MRSTALDDLRGRLSGVRPNGRGFQACCPTHDDRNPSLSVNPGRAGNVVMYCHAGCDNRDIMAALGLEMSALFDEPKLKGAYSSTRTYRYPGGRIVERRPIKGQPRKKRMWQAGDKDTDRTLYGADQVTDNVALVFVVEGERDVEVLQAIGAVAVTPPMGADPKGTQLDKFDWTPLHGKSVIAIADADDAGRKHAREVCRILAGNVQFLQIWESKHGKDFADHYAAGYGLDPSTFTRTDPSEDDVDLEDNDGPRLWNATDLKPAGEPEWLADKRVQSRATNLLIGDEGIGKSLFWVWLISYVTTGMACPEFGIPKREPQRVIIVCTEDDWTTIVRPRLEAGGVDLTKVQMICADDDGSGAPEFPRDLNLIYEANPAPALIVVDAWLDTVPAHLSVKDPQQARLALRPWKDLASTTGAAVLLLCHTNRVATANARDKYGATMELRKVARLTLFAQAGDDEGTLLIGPEKANATGAVRASKFEIQAKSNTARLHYTGESDRTARQILADAYKSTTAAGAAKIDATAWLADHLAGGSVWAADVKAAAVEDNIGRTRLETAKTKLRVVSAFDGATRKWFWHLPHLPAEPPATSEVDC
jgi:hypothetical protein